MSHFTVLVKAKQSLLEQKLQETGDQNKAITSAIHAMLAPFQENNMGDCPKEYLRFNDVTEECRKEYETETTKKLKHKQTGLIISPYNHEELDKHCLLNPEWVEARDKVAKEANVDLSVAENRMRFASDFKGHKHDRSAFEEIEVPVSEDYSDFDEYMTEYHGYKIDEEIGVYGYWENPNAKWDWYSIGGRWNGLIPVRDGRGLQGSPGLMTPRNKTNKDGVFETADIAFIKDIDFDKMDGEKKKAIDKFMENLRLYSEIVEEFIKPGVPYEEYKDDDRYTDEVGWMQWELHDRLRNWKVFDKCAVYKESKKDSDNKESKPEVKYFDVSDITREFVEQFSYEFEWGTWAVLDEDGWKEKGEMGWFGVSSATSESTREYREGYVDKYLRDEAPDTVVAVVDCHI